MNHRGAARANEDFVAEAIESALPSAANCLHELILAGAVASPQAPALLGDRPMSYGELGDRSAEWSALLHARGVGRGDVVGIWTRDPVQAAVGCLAVLRLGAAFVPLDEASPPERVGYVLSDSRARALLTDTALLAKLTAPPTECLCFDAPPRTSSRQAQVAGEPDDIAYVIYTSGSTGRPKGVAVRHRNIVNFVAARTVLYGAAPRLVPIHSLSFDPAVGGLAWALATGGSVALVDAELRGDPDALAGLIQRFELTHMSAVPAAYQAILQAASPGALRSLRGCMLGGERLPPALAQRHYELVPDAPLFNEYGPTETTVCSTIYPVPRADVPDPLPIGAPLLNTFCYVLDEQQRPVPDGEAGELYIGGDGVAAGYLNRPELTAERFLPDPFAAARGVGFASPPRMYRTGDRARLRPDGLLEFLGRIDFQVKVRGHRVELPEVELHITAHDRVTAAVAVLRDTALGNSLVAYYTTSDGAPHQALRAALSQKLPSYMVPSFLVHLPQLPLNAAGKVDRNALPDPMEADAGARPAGTAPSTLQEQRIATIWADVLSIPTPSLEDDFFALGGHSLLATMVVSRIRDQLGLRVPVRSLFAAPVLRDFAAAVARDGKAVMGLHSSSEHEPEGPIAIAPLQETFWYLAQIEPHSAAYVVRARFRIKGALDRDRLGRALARIVADNEVLRTRFVLHQGEPVQVIVPSVDVPLEWHDLRTLPEPAERAREQSRQFAATSFDLSRCPLLRCQLLGIADDDFVLDLAVHHIVFDGWSVNLFLRELFAAYEADAAEGAPQANALRRVHYRHYAHDARTRLDGIRLGELRSYYRKKLQDLPAPLTLPTDFPRPTGEHVRGGASVRARLSSELTARLRARCVEQGVTHFVFSLAVFELIVTRWTGEHDVVVGAPMAVRDESHLEGMIGCFINSVVLRTEVPALDRPFGELLERVKASALGGLAHAEYPFDWLVVDLRAERAQRGDNPLFRLFFNDIDRRRQLRKLDGIELLDEGDDNPLSKFDLTFYIHEWPEHDEIHLVYDPALFSAARMQELVAQFERVMDQVTRDLTRPLGAYDLLTEPMRRAIPDRDAALHADGGAARIQDAFYENAAAQPQRRAVLDAGTSLSYRELAQYANAIASELVQAGARPGDAVAIHAPRSPHLVAAMIGTLEAGCTFTVLDPDQPAAWNQRLLQALGSPIWLEAGELNPDRELSAYVAQQLPHRLRIAAGARSDARLAASCTPDSPAYVGFTSGTTGVPKGVVGTHRPVVHFIGWYTATFGLDSTDRVSMLSGLGHDPLLRDIFAPLSAGATLCVPSAAARLEPALLVRFLREQQVSVAHLTPGLGTLITAGIAAEQPLSALRLMLFGGERLRGEDIAQARRYAPGARLVNCYGTTETPQVMGYHELPAGSDTTPPVGRGIADTQLLVLNPRGDLCGVGELGAIHVRSPYLSSGYLTQHGLDTTRTAHGLYATGDLGRYDTAGLVEFVGRPDRQVKVRGYRIELGAVEAALEALPQITRAHVIARPQPDGGTALDAYLVADSAHPADARAVRRALEGRLIEAMIPSSYAFVERFPLTNNGKVDARRLVAEASAETVSRPEYREPRSQTEEVIARLWAELFELPRVGINDDFFELGGHSLLAVRMVTQLSERLGSVVPLRLLMEHPTVGRLAEALHTTGSIHAESLVVELRTGGSRPPFWMIHPIGGHVVFARRFVALLDPEQNVLGIQARGLDGRSPAFESIPDMARHYLELIRERQPSGPYYIGGPSLGGKVAYEIAQQLVAGGEQPGLIVMFDTFAPGFPRAKPALGWLRDKLAQTMELGFKGVVTHAGERLLSKFAPPPAAAPAEPPAANTPLANTVRRVAAASERASRSYDVKPYSGSMTLFRAGRQPEWPGMDFSDIRNGWGAFAARVNVEVVDATHQDIFDEPCVRDLARRFTRVLELAFDRNSYSNRLSTIGGTPIRSTRPPPGRSIPPSPK